MESSVSIRAYILYKGILKRYFTNESHMYNYDRMKQRFQSRRAKTCASINTN